MKRLTIEFNGGYVPQELCVTDQSGKIDDCELCFENCRAFETGTADCKKCVIDKCFNRLGAYEDTGLTPEQIKEMDCLYKIKCKELAERKTRQQPKRHWR